ncbi:hypothetical protein NSPZN2_180009 [Nitrospira defluvii]|uniref:Uncharacterized protein n=1 Tax=Nitrospira defluvii TaxID=330214 RepID=A0ABN7LE62_9BACT|nr:hypothetical protein NSPZN2_180009 [Nitrospira defluvii]
MSVQYRRLAKACSRSPVRVVHPCRFTPSSLAKAIELPVMQGAKPGMSDFALSACAISPDYEQVHMQPRGGETRHAREADGLSCLCIGASPRGGARGGMRLALAGTEVLTDRDEQVIRVSMSRTRRRRWTT